MVLDALAKEHILGEQVLVDGYFFENLLYIRLVQKTHLHILRPKVVNPLDVLLQVSELNFGLEDEHYLEAVLLRGGQEDHRF